MGVMVLGLMENVIIGGGLMLIVKRMMMWRECLGRLFSGGRFGVRWLRGGGGGG